jgi:hypothetical protein
MYRLWVLLGRKKYMIFVFNMVWQELNSHTSYWTSWTDIIIVEDDPYYFLQEGSSLTSVSFLSLIEYVGPYIPKSEREIKYPKADDEAIIDFISSLVPSFVKWASLNSFSLLAVTQFTRFDYEGRVIRLDTFSKVSLPNINPETLKFIKYVYRVLHQERV